MNLTAKSSKLHAKFKSNRICSSTPAGSRVMVPCNVQQFSNCAILLLSFKLSDQNKSFYRRHKSKQTNKSFSNKTLLKFRKSQNDFFKRTFPPKTKQWNLKLTCFCSFLWGQLKTPKRHFEINRPLVFSQKKVNSLLIMY